jgi:predicted neutral ceramidase superfamily lipid hydrolase
VDCHNSKTSGKKIEPGGEEYFAFEDAFDSLRAGEPKDLRMGVAFDDLKDFSIRDGVAGAGLKAAVFAMGAKKYCIGGRGRQREPRHALV